jgi:hypothetical protein
VRGSPFQVVVDDFEPGREAEVARLEDGDLDGAHGAAEAEIGEEGRGGKGGVKEAVHVTRVGSSAIPFSYKVRRAPSGSAVR